MFRFLVDTSGDAAATVRQEKRSRRITCEVKEPTCAEAGGFKEITRRFTRQRVILGGWLGGTGRNNHQLVGSFRRARGVSVVVKLFIFIVPSDENKDRNAPGCCVCSGFRSVHPALLPPFAERNVRDEHPARAEIRKAPGVSVLVSLYIYFFILHPSA